MRARRPAARAAPGDEVEGALPVDGEPAEEGNVDQCGPVEHDRPHCHAGAGPSRPARASRRTRSRRGSVCGSSARATASRSSAAAAVPYCVGSPFSDARHALIMTPRSSSAPAGAGQQVRAAGAALIDEDDVVALVDAAPDAVDHGRLLGRGTAGTAGEVREGIRPRRLLPCGHDDDAKADPRPQTGIAVLRDEQRVAPRGHALHDAVTQWQLGL